MQAIIAALPNNVLNYVDSQGLTIVHPRFNPVSYDMPVVYSIREADKGTLLKIQFDTETTKGNIDDIIKLRIPNVVDLRGMNEVIAGKRQRELMLENIERLLRDGNIRCFVSQYYYNLSREYHVDFTRMAEANNITSYFSHSYETRNTVVICNPKNVVTNNLIYLQNNVKAIAVPIESDYIQYSNCINIPIVKCVFADINKYQIERRVARDTEYLNAIMDVRFQKHIENLAARDATFIQLRSRDWKLKKVFIPTKQPQFVCEYIAQKYI